MTNSLATKCRECKGDLEKPKYKLPKGNVCQKCQRENARIKEMMRRYNKNKSSNLQP